MILKKKELETSKYEKTTWQTNKKNSIFETQLY